MTAAHIIPDDNDDFVDDTIVLGSSSDDDDASGRFFSPPAEQRSVATRVKSRKRKFAAPDVTAAVATVAAEMRQKPSKPKVKRSTLEDVNRRAMKDIQNELRTPSPPAIGSGEEVPASEAKFCRGSGSSRKKAGHGRANAKLSSSSGTPKEKDAAAKEEPCPQLPSGDSIVILDSSEKDPLSSSHEDLGKKGEKKVGKSVQRKDPQPKPKPKPRPKRSFGPKKQQLPPPPPTDDDDFAQEPILVESDDDDEEESPSTALNVVCPRKGDRLPVNAYFVGKPIPAAQAKVQWRHRYDKSVGAGSPKCLEHYEEAVVDGKHYKVGDCVALNGDDSEYLGKVLEFFKKDNQENWCRVQWFFRFSDTAIGDLEDVDLDNKRVFLSDDEDDNMIECIIKKVEVSYAPLVDTFAKKKIKQRCDYYFDMGYTGDFSTFYKLSSDSGEVSSLEEAKQTTVAISNDPVKPELFLLDMYCGCGAMSTGLSMGAALGGLNLVTKWALDYNEHACNSMKYNHPEAEVRNEDAECFLLLLKEWQKLCTKYEGHVADDSSNASSPDSAALPTDEYEVEKVVDIRIAEIEKTRKPDTSSRMPERPIKRRLEFKVHWKGYPSDQDTWEPVDHLDSCQERIRDFVLEGRRRHILPLPGDVDMVCGGPPCQGASGYNRFRNTEAPLNCPRNRQMMIFMDIVDFLRPKFVLMENVVDILKFRQGLLGRYAMFRLVDMRYQAKLGMMAAGSYGLPQFRMRVFLWGAVPGEILPAFPLPTHDVISRAVVPNQFSRNVVKHIGERQLEKALLLGDSISDLPPVKNSETRDDIPYRDEPKTQFQTRIRSARNVFYGQGPQAMNSTLHDHRPLRLNDDDYQRACRIPKRKGANFRDLGGLRIKEDNSVTLDLTVEREYLPSGKPLVPDYAISFIKGRSLKPFARMWWDETVPTVITRAEPHNHRMLHPTQDRVLTIRENARLQGFPDWYKLTGSVKERYIQVGNAVAVPVARALGYSLALTSQRLCKEPRLELPAGFPCSEDHDEEKVKARKR